MDNFDLDQKASLYMYFEMDLVSSRAFMVPQEKTMKINNLKSTAYGGCGSRTREKFL